LIKRTTHGAFDEPSPSRNFKRCLDAGRAIIRRTIL
jgi:hypothetical protein